MAHDALAAALSFVAARYAIEQESIALPPVKVKGLPSKVKGTALPNASGETKGKKTAKGEASSPETIARKAAKPVIVTVTTCERWQPGTFDAANFAFFFRHVECPVSGENRAEVAIGKDTNGEPMFAARGTPAMQRDRRIALIAGFIGYDDSLSYVANECRAKDAAKRRLYPQHRSAYMEQASRTEERSAALTAQGWVAGLPYGMRKIVYDLLARERLAASDMCSYQKKAEDPTECEEQRTIAQGMIVIEQARLVEIRAELRKLLPRL